MSICISGLLSLLRILCNSSNFKKLVRNLSPGEIISQIILSKDYINDWSTQKKITNQVLMGEGSPFLNLDNVKVAIDNSKNKDGLEYGRTRITVSTVGVGIKKMI